MIYVGSHVGMYVRDVVFLCLHQGMSYLMNSPVRKGLHRTHTGRPSTGRDPRRRWDTSGCCSRPPWSVGNTRTCRPRSGPCRCRRPGTPPGCSRTPCSLADTHTGRPHTGRCRCTRRDRRTRSRPGLPTPGCTHSCRFGAGTHRGHCSSRPGLGRGGQWLLFYGL